MTEEEELNLRNGLELLVEIAAREQRYICADWIENPCARPEVIEKAQTDIQNTPCPDVKRVLELWREAKEKNDRHIESETHSAGYRNRAGL